MSSSTSARIRPTSATSSSAARRLSGGSSSRWSPTIDASATSAASGVRSSCDDVGDEPPVLVLGRLEPADRVGQGAGHPVEPLGPGPELVARRDGHPRRQVAALDPLGDAPGLFHRRQDAARHAPRTMTSASRISTRAPTAQGQAQLVDGGIDAR